MEPDKGKKHAHRRCGDYSMFNTMVKQIHSAKHGNTTLKILTYNCGLLTVQVCGLSAFSNPAFGRERFPCVLRNLKCCDVDIIILQEIYSLQHIHEAIECMAVHFPFHAFHFTGTIFRLNNGLLVLSKYEISNSNFHKYYNVALIERIFACKGFMECEFATPCGAVVIVNHHTTAGGPEKCREQELEQSNILLQQHLADGKIVFMAGDINAGPSLSKSNFDYLLSRGWVDSWLEANDCEGFTWDNKNVLNSSNVHASSPSCRVDHIMPHKNCAVRVLSASLEFTKSDVETEIGSTTASDHYGVVVWFEICGIESPSSAIPQPGA